VSLQERVTTAFQEHFNATPRYIVRAPGRVNLIGEHTDYNDGFVLPMAIDRATWIALSPRNDGLVEAYSLDFDQTVTFSLADFKNEQTGWAEYVKGVAWVLQEAGHRINGWTGVIAGDVPIAAGLSSSASIELATARAFAAISGVEWKPANMALLAQKAENQWVGMNCGIMDQMISAAGVAGTALLIDCRSLATENVPLPPDTVVVVLDTATRRGLVDSAYNERRSQCESAARTFGIKALRDISLADFEHRAGELDDLTHRRARHVISENERTLAAAEAMKAGDAKTLGQLMNASHASLRDDFEVSSEALDVMVEKAQAHAACYGARMTGAGFGGCAVALVQADAADSFAGQVGRDYTKATNLQPNIYICAPAQGAEVVRG
jgi:galactokinase